MRTTQEIDQLRLTLNSTYSAMLKQGLITQQEFNQSLREMGLRIKSQYEKDGFKTDFFPQHQK